MTDPSSGSNDADDVPLSPSPSSPSPERQQQQTTEETATSTTSRWSSWIVISVAVLIGVAKSAPADVWVQWVVWPAYRLLLNIAGVTTGVALGLGFAAHVYDQLTEWHDRQVHPAHATTPSLSRSRTPLRKANSNAAVLLQQDDYRSLLQSAGYLSFRRNTTTTQEDTAEKRDLLRGQVVRSDKLLQSQHYYAFDRKAHAPGAPRHALDAMQEFWPTLPAVVNEKLGYAMENILRDFVACWFKSVDEGCRYRNFQVEEEEEETEPPPRAHQHARVMMYSVALHRPSPFLDSLYESMAIIFGNLATRVEHMNLFAIILLKWTRVLAHTFKFYRTLRKSVVHKQRLAQHGAIPATRSPRRSSRRGRNAGIDESAGEDHVEHDSSSVVSEISMTKEFLLLGKLHRAITFGLDVPALLFADATGRECGTPSLDNSGQSSNHETTVNATEVDDDVLADRLFNSPILTECELDYNRVVGHRMVRALVTRQDYGSPIVASLLTEMMGGCVLTPIMSIFSPEYLNSWIIQGLSSSTAEGESKEDTGDEEKKNQEDGDEHKTSSNDPSADVAALPVDPLLGSVNEAGSEDTQPATTHKSTTSPLSRVAEESAKPSVENHVSPESAALHDLSENAAMLMSPSAEERSAASPKEASSPSFGDNIIALLSLALVDLQKYVDFEECRTARINHQEVNVNWDDPGCRATVLRLVLVIELALTHGRCTYKLPLDQSGGEADSLHSEEQQDDEDEEDLDNDLDDSERPVEVTLPEYESATLSQLLMEMTGDIDAFEERVATENTLAAEHNANKYEDMIVEEYKPSATEQSTLRTLIAAWLHTGQIYRTVGVLVQAHATALAPYYHNNAFLRSRSSATGFVRQLKALAGVDILVDTMTVLACPRLDETDNEALHELIRKSTLPSPSSLSAANAEDMDRVGGAIPSSVASTQRMATSSTPRYLDFHRNESFAASLRSERERRMHSWRAITAEEEGEFSPVCRSIGTTQEDISLHRELHHIARIFYTGTNIIGIRDAARRKNSNDAEGQSLSESAETDDEHVSLLTVEMACQRRRIEVPDDDSSFLLRAQVSQMDAMRDADSQSMSF